tara:strand:- start:514 stop:1380 length:867 start_codon:yes stop_codon:yes gene_type:complete
MSLFPIGFCIPAEKIIEYVPVKTKELSVIYPTKNHGSFENYTFNEEEEYYKEYQSSIFAITKKKGGWDCLRHYEILANGCIPYFVDIEKCPENTLFRFPREMIKFTNIHYNNYKDSNWKRQCNRFICSLLDYTRKYLTTEAMAEYFIEKANIKKIDKVLYLNNGQDYLSDLIYHGLYCILSNIHDYPKKDYMYKGYTKIKDLYGKGFTYTGLLERRDDTRDKTFEEDIQKRFYDKIIFSDYHKMSKYEFVMSYYKPQEVILMCGADIHKCKYHRFLERGHTMFVREIN